MNPPGHRITRPPRPTLTEKEAAGQFARAWNLLSTEPLEPFLDQRSVYESQCVIMCQGSKDSPVALALFEVEGPWIIGIDICVAPSPSEAERTGVFPGLA